MKLTDKQIQSFHTNGFLVLRQFADEQRCDAIYEKAYEHLSQSIEPIESEEEYLRRDSDSSTVRRLRQVYDREKIFREWMEEPSIRPVLEQLLGEPPVLVLAHHNSIMTKLPQKSSITSWHQDIRYWHYTNDNLISVWLSLGDEFLENGLLEFIPGSHKMSFRRDQYDSHLTFRDDLEENKALIATRTHCELHKGDVVLFHAKTLHYAHHNSTDRPKISFVYTLRAQSNLPIKGTLSNFKEVVL